jgi:hypothetical protein
MAIDKIFDLTQVGSVIYDSGSSDDNNFQGYLMFGFFSLIHFTIYGLYMGSLSFFNQQQLKLIIL